MKKILLSMIIMMGFVFPSTIQAKEVPPALNLFKTVDWRYFADGLEFNFKVCNCKIGAGDVVVKGGFAMTIVEPIGLIEVVNTPWHFPSLGLKLDTRVTRSQGNSRDGGDESGGFKYNHFIIFPVFSVLGYIQDLICFERVNLLSLGMMGELLPQSKNDILALILNPMPLITGLFCAVASIGDCMASSFGSPINSLTCTSGCWVLPGTASTFVQAKQPVAEAAANTQKTVVMMSQLAMLTKTSNASFAFLSDEMGNLKNSMCGEKLFFERIKTQYAMNLAGPTVGRTFQTGVYNMTYQPFKNKLGSEDAFSFWFWRKRDFCMGAYDCRSTFAPR